MESGDASDDQRCIKQKQRQARTDNEGVKSIEERRNEGAIMKKTIVGLAAMVLSLVGGGAVFAVETGHIIGSSEGGIEVAGHLGVKNTEENPIISYSEDWINVNLPTATIFYNVEGQKEIRSSSYGIRNNSARGVKVSLKSFENVAEPNETARIKRLDLKVIKGGAANVSLINEGVINTESFGLEIFTIPSGAHDVDVPFPKEAWPAYTYVGEVAESLTAPSNPTYLLVLNFQALDKI